MKKTLMILLTLLIIFSTAVSASSTTTSSEGQRRYNEMRANEQYQMLLENLSEQTMSQNARNSSVDYYGGAYLNDDGNLVVCVTNDYDFESNVIQSHTGEDIILEVVDYAYSELVNEQNEISSLYESLFEQFEGIESEEEALLSSLSGTYIDDERNRLIIEIDGLCDEKVELFRNLISNKAFLEFEEGDSITWTSTQWYPGDAISSSPNSYLTTGYPVYYVNDNGDIVQGFITAGHGFAVGDFVYTGENAESLIGRCIRSICNGKVDAALIEITNQNYTLSYRTKYHDVELYSHVYAFPGKNTYLYMDGATTKGTDGKVLSNSVTITVEGNVHTNFIKTNIDSSPGDSGAAVYMPTGSIAGNMSARGEEEVNGETICYSYIGFIEYALEALDCQLWPCDGEDCEIDDCIHLNH